MINKRDQWGVYRTAAKASGWAPFNLVGTFVGLGHVLYATREQAAQHLKSGSSFCLEVKKFNPRKDKR